MRDRVFKELGAANAYSFVTTGYNNINVACWGCPVFDFSIICFLLLRGVEKEAQSQSGLGNSDFS